MTFEEKRQYKRVQAHFKIELKIGDDQNLATALAKNISKGGIYFQTDQLLGPNDLVEISFKLPGNDIVYTITGQVVRLIHADDPKNESKCHYGAGIKFINIDSDALSAIQQFIEKVS